MTKNNELVRKNKALKSQIESLEKVVVNNKSDFASEKTQMTGEIETLKAKLKRNQMEGKAVGELRTSVETLKEALASQKYENDILKGIIDRNEKDIMADDQRRRQSNKNSREVLKLVNEMLTNNETVRMKITELVRDQTGSPNGQAFAASVPQDSVDSNAANDAVEIKPEADEVDPHDVHESGNGEPINASNFNPNTQDIHSTGDFGSQIVTSTPLLKQPSTPQRFISDEEYSRLACIQDELYDSSPGAPL